MLRRLSSYGVCTVPIYEYACGTCEHRFETIQRARDEPLKDCPECGEPALRKLLSAPVFRLKGSGWYETDFKTGSKKNVSDAGDGSGVGQDNGTGKTDSSNTTSDTLAKDSTSKTSDSGKTTPTAGA